MFALLLVLFQVAPDSSAHEGYQGNLYYQNDQFQEAQNAYERGLSLYPTTIVPENVYYGLQNNLGLALHGQGNIEEAFTAFDEAIATAPDSGGASLANYNAGNNAFGAQNTEAALEYYRQAMLNNPENEQARFNYEYVKRQQQQNQSSQQNEEQDDQEQQDQEQQEQENQEQQQNQEQEQQQEEQDQQEQGQEQQEQDQQEQKQQQQQAQQLSREEAERILQALANEEKELLREVQKGEPTRRRVTKDW